jgi:hypothetical protein
MNTFVTFEIAKLLKEKGFEQNQYNIKHVYATTREHILEDPHQHVEHNIPAETEQLRHISSLDEYNTKIAIAPTIAEVVMWLYEKHKIWIAAREFPNNDGFYYVISGKNSPYINVATPTEAYIEAILRTLKNLI